MPWGNGSTVPTSGKNLIIVGTETDSDDQFHVHIRIFDARGDRVTDTDSTNAAANSTLAQILPGLLSPHALTDAEKAQVITALIPIVGQTLVRDNTDAFLVEGSGSISGKVDGGTGGTDGLIFVDPAEEESWQAFNPPGADSSGIATVFSKSVAYLGLDRVDFYDDTDPFNPVVTGTIFNDSIRVSEDPGVAGGLRIDYSGRTIALDALQVTALQSLRIDAIEGSDTIEVESLPDNFYRQPAPLW